MAVYPLAVALSPTIAGAVGMALSRAARGARRAPPLEARAAYEGPPPAFAGRALGRRGDPGWLEPHLPRWSPPGWVYGPVWTALYASLGAAAWHVAAGPATAGSATWFAWFAAMLVLNAAWTPLFFGTDSPEAALPVSAGLAAASAALVAAAPAPPVALLALPNAAWVAFALAINAAVVRSLNGRACAP